MKKVLSAGLALLILALCAVPAFAQTTLNQDGSAAVTISTIGEEDYQFTFPADTVIPWEAPSTDIGAVTATKLIIKPSKVVRVSVESANGYTLVHTEDAEKTIAYTLSGADSLVFGPGEVGKSFPLSVGVTEEQWAQAAAGEHRDTLTFTVEYADA